MQRTTDDDAQAIKEAVIEGMQDKKGGHIVSLDFRAIPNALCRFFVICHGTSRVQVEAIAEGVEAKVRNDAGARPWNREGFENAEWILLDYVNVVVHIFQDKVRDFYRLEKLWADAESQEYSA
jgi:ribosome-associated protein